MIENKILKTHLLGHLHPYFEHKSYVGDHPSFDFLRSTRFGHSGIVCATQEYEDGIYFQFFLGIRHDIIEKQLPSILGRHEYFNTISNTLMVNSTFIDHSMPNRSFCTSRQEVINLGNRFIDFMDRNGFSFLDHYKSLAKLNQLLNQKTSSSSAWTNHNYQRCFRGMLIAKILNDPNYDRYFLMHQQYLAERGFGGQILSRFNTTFARLQKISLN
jgi:hypothetical protein